MMRARVLSFAAAVTAMLAAPEALDGPGADALVALAPAAWRPLVVEAVAMAALEGAWHEGRGEPTQKGVAVQSIVLMVERAEAEAVGLLRRILDRPRDTASLRRLAGLITNPDGSQPVLAQHGTDRHADATRLAWDLASTTRCPITLRIAPLLPNNMTAARAILTAYLAKADRLDAHRAEASTPVMQSASTRQWPAANCSPIRARTKRSMRRKCRGRTCRLSTAQAMARPNHGWAKPPAPSSTPSASAVQPVSPPPVARQSGTTSMYFWPSHSSMAPRSAG